MFSDEPIGNITGTSSIKNSRSFSTAFLRKECEFIPRNQVPGEGTENTVCAQVCGQRTGRS